VRPPAEPARPPLGRIGPYELTRLLETRGLFGMFEAKHVVLGHTVRIASVAPSVAPRPELTAKLERHARLLARLPGDAVFGLCELSRDGERVGVVTEAPSHDSLRTIVKNAKPLRLDEAVALGVVIARAVAKLHKLGIAHLGLAPENVFPTPDGTVRLAGLFDAGGEPGAEGELTMPDSLGPEAAYRAPERVAGAPQALPSDVFSIGAILSELMGGGAPSAPAGGVIERARTERRPVPDAPEASVALTQTVARAVERQPALRYDTAGRLADELETLLDDGVSAESVARGVVQREGFLVGRERPMLRVGVPVSTVALRLGVVTLAMIGVFALAALANDDGPGPRGSAAAASAELKILAHPWAEVLVDGERLDTTPIGRPVRVPPGRHELTFKHPNAPDERRTVDVGPGQRTTVDVEMEVVRIVDAGVDASP
jgi:serine/threonine-protein kinase